MTRLPGAHTFSASRILARATDARLLGWLGTIVFAGVLLFLWLHWGDARASGEDVTWLTVVVSAMTAGHVLYVGGLVLWSGRAARPLRAIGFGVLVLGAFGTVSAAVLIAPLTALLLPSLGAAPSSRPAVAAGPSAQA